METSAGAIYHVARDGQVIGAFPFPALAAKFKDGSVKPTDHYLIEGTSDWKLVSELKPRFAEHEQLHIARTKRLKAEALAAKEAKEREAAKAKALEIEAEWKRREDDAREAARLRAEQRKPMPWKCHTCGDIFTSAGKAATFPEATGGWTAFFLLLAAGFLCALGYNVFFLFTIIGGMFALFACGYLVAFGVERGLQQFHAYRPRCPNCSSPYCSKQPE